MDVTELNNNDKVTRGEVLDLYIRFGDEVTSDP